MTENDKQSYNVHFLSINTKARGKYRFLLHKKGFEDTIEVIRGHQRSSTEEQKIQRTKDKEQTMIYKIRHRKLQIGQHKPHKKTVVNSDASEG